MKRAAVPSILVAVVLLAIGVIAEAQEPKKVPRIGVIFPAFSSVFSPFMAAFREGLHDLSYIEGKSVVVEARYGEGKEDRLPALAAELVHLRVDIIVAGGGNATLAAKNATKNIPIIFLSATSLNSPSHDMAERLGADAFLAFPVDPEQLDAVIQGTIAKRKNR